MVVSQMIQTEQVASVNPRIQSVVMHICARYRARRILGIGRGAQLLSQPLCHHLRHAGYDVTVIDPGDSYANPQPETFINRPPLVDSNTAQDAPFDMVVSIELGEPFSIPSVLIKLASMKLRPSGVFILSIPYSGGYLKNLFSAMREWLTPPYFTSWDGGYIQRWSKKCLTTLLETYGFTVVELIGVRGSSLQWESLILVAKKTGDSQSPP